MPVERWTPERRRELTRTTLIAAAAEVFARRGFEGASLEEIAETAGFTRGAIYKTFGSKEELFFAVSDDDFAARLQSFADKVGESAELAEPGELAAMWRESVVGGRADLALNMEVRLYAMRNPEVTARFAEHQRTTRRALAQFIVDTAARLGLTTTVPAMTLAGVLEAASWGISESAAVDPGDEGLFDAFFDIFVRASCAGDDAPAIVGNSDAEATVFNRTIAHPGEGR
jgi:AcrR family transcriptional regulator